MSSSSDGTRLRWVVLEAALIVLGLGAGWFVTEIQDQRQRDEAAREAEAAMFDELTENRARIAAARDYHLGTTTALEPWLFPGASGSPPLQEIFAEGFLKPARVFDAAWTTAAETGALRDVSAETRSTFADAYARIEGYGESGLRIADIIYRSLWDVGFAGTYAKWREIHTLTLPLIYQECEVLTVLDEVLRGWDLEGTLERQLPDDPGMAGCTRLFDFEAR